MEKEAGVRNSWQLIQRCCFEWEASEGVKGPGFCFLKWTMWMLVCSRAGPSRMERVNMQERARDRAQMEGLVKAREEILRLWEGRQV